MDGYETLRAKAAQKLDEAIQAARREYRATCDKINRLRRELGDEKPTSLKTDRPVSEAIEEYMPRERPFTVADMLEILTTVEPEIHRTRAAVKWAMWQMTVKKIIRRVAKDSVGHVLFVAFEHEMPTRPFAVMPMSDIIAGVLEDAAGPMRLPELVVAIQGLGCRDQDPAPAVLRTVRKSLYGNPRRFQKDGEGRWGLGKSE